MTLQDAIITLKREYFGDSEFMELAKQMGAKALEKQIPLKPKKIERQPYFRKHYSKSFICPKCNNSILGTGRPYCAFCGQALDWGHNE